MAFCQVVQMGLRTHDTLLTIPSLQHSSNELLHIKGGQVNNSVLLITDLLTEIVKQIFVLHLKGLISCKA